jgi:hypothetical protein
MKGFVSPSKSPFGAHVLFVTKKDGTKRMCVDHWALNKAANHNCYSLLQIDHSLNQLMIAIIFSRLILCSGYYQISVCNRNVKKTTCQAYYGSYNWLGMSFGST